ncbi:MAG TPA: hypothetical protein VFJ43_00515, partial [Bacteroidia bacterium]|nr:hypothetical protein [Bacteroidia bacterium]
MKLTINDNSAIGEIQKKFQEQFPFLRLEFFYGGKENSAPNPLNHILDETKKLGTIRPVHHAGELEFSGEECVANVENLFRDRFGLSVQISRRSGAQ